MERCLESREEAREPGPGPASSSNSEPGARGGGAQVPCLLSLPRGQRTEGCGGPEMPESVLGSSPTPGKRASVREVLCPCADLSHPGLQHPGYPPAIAGAP